jgi:hypothetical protein
MSSIVKIEEVRANVHQSTVKDHIVYGGGSRYEVYKESANNAFLINHSFQINPNTNQIVDRRLQLEYEFTITTSTPNTQKESYGVDFSVRQFPLNNIIENASVRINGTLFSENNQKFIAMARYGNDVDERENAFGKTASYPDDLYEYGLTGTGYTRTAINIYGASSGETHRGGFPCYVGVGSGDISPTNPAGTFISGVERTSTGANSLIYRIKVVEPILISPFISGIHQGEGLTNCNQINVDLQFTSDIAKKFISERVGKVATSYTIALTGAPSLIYTLITPNELYIPIPRQILPYSFLDTHRKTATGPGAISAYNSKFSIDSDTFKLSQVPHSVYIWAQPVDTARNVKKGDFFAVLEKLSIRFNNQTLFNQATTETLFDIAKKNGCNMQYVQWSEYVGSVLRIDFSSDVGLPSYLSPGVPAQLQMQILPSFINRAKFATPIETAFELFVVFQYGGTITVMENACIQSIANISQVDALESNKPESKIEEVHNHSEVVGGKLHWSDVKTALNKTARVGQLISPLFGPLAPELGVASTIVRGLTGGQIRKHR